MGQTRDLFKKIRDTKGTFHAKMSTIKDRNGMDLTEAEDIKKRWQEYTEELYKMILITYIATMVWSHLEPDRQCSCLENPRDGGAWWAAIYGVTQSRTRLK